MGRLNKAAVKGLPIRGELRVPKAKNRAAARGPAIFDGREALEVVGSEDGIWNWCLLGPEPEELPLCAGGTGGIEEMQAAIGLVKHSFGLLRMHFLTEGGAQTWHLFVHASDVGDGKVSVKDRMQAMKKPEMEKAIRAACPFNASIALHSKEDCNAEFVVLKLREIVTQDQLEIVTVENLHAATEAWKEEHKEEEQEKVKEEEERKMVVEQVQQRVEETPALAQEIEAEPEAEVVAGTSEEPVRQRKPFRPPNVGDPIEIFSATSGQWVSDGEVVAITMEQIEENGECVPAGSTKVVYGNGRRCKWVPGHKLADIVRRSPRPRAPPTQCGVHQLEVYSWFMPGWEQRYFELNKGFMQWWPSMDDAKAGAPPEATVHLLGLQLEQVGNCIKFRTDSTTRAIYTMKYEDEEQRTDWSNALWMHAEFCEEECEFFKSRDCVPIGEAQARERAGKVAAAEHLRRPSLASMNEALGKTKVEDFVV